MKRLLSIELQKIWKNRASKVLTITYFVLLSLLSLIASIKFDIGIFKFHLAEMGIFNFPYIWHFNTFIAAFLKIFLAVIIVSMMANEYSYGTLKQNLIDGMSKKELILSKFLTIILFAGISTVFVFVMSLLLGYSFSSYTEIGIVFSDLEYLLAYFVKLVGFFSFCLFLGVLIKRSAFALGALILWFMVEMISYAFAINNLKNTELVNKIYDFFPLMSMWNLIKEPFTRMSSVKNLQQAIGENSIKNYDVHWYSIVIVLMWISIFIFLSHYIIKKRDL
ncbi:ABC transporter permease [Flavobacterium aquatile]|uniref:Excinuclease ABC subunit B n=1 Tax=Flavobacterium aquatile LMG 4008 = ATCC 11947 TaxID=1453498 RepID=A0A095V0V1_9FLAO|nr:ABC transporter permease [Flavobacterium aquatile]KGD68490.1 excinuclease ABC subunit B [Flavobacterium aquatile LMG 4008 = ATCC 11947]OXA68580.1 ABC transporter permease [Flavobacterium aquatile LMG 4008 = ATCC 11947]GEC79461.1 ABC transporter permease [Flavobacterium aquatile]